MSRCFVRLSPVCSLITEGILTSVLTALPKWRGEAPLRNWRPLGWRTALERPLSVSWGRIIFMIAWKVCSGRETPAPGVMRTYPPSSDNAVIHRCPHSLIPRSRECLALVADYIAESFNVLCGNGDLGAVDSLSGPMDGRVLS